MLEKMALFLAFEFQKFRSSLIDLGAQVVNRHSGPRSVRERGGVWGDERGAGVPEAREAPLLSSTFSQVPRGGLGCGTSGWMSLRVSVRVSEQRATQIQVTWRGTEAAEAPGAAERSVVARASGPPLPACQSLLPFLIISLLPATCLIFWPN